MSTHRHVHSSWILLALLAGIFLFGIVAILPEFIAKESSSGKIVIPDRFDNLSSGELSTTLNTRFDSLATDPYCLNDLAISAKTSDKSWDSVRSFIDGFFTESSKDVEIQLRKANADTPGATILSICYFEQNMYALRAKSKGAELGGFDLIKVNATSTSEPLTEFLAPITRTLTMHTNLFKEEVLGIAAREVADGHVAWYYFKYNPSAEKFEQVEWCDRWTGAEKSPYGDKSVLDCQYEYKFK